MATLEQLSKMDVQTYEELPGALSALGVVPCLRTRRYTYTVTGNDICFVYHNFLVSSTDE